MRAFLSPHDAIQFSFISSLSTSPSLVHCHISFSIPLSYIRISSTIHSALLSALFPISCETIALARFIALLTGLFRSPSFWCNRVICFRFAFTCTLRSIRFLGLAMGRRVYDLFIPLWNDESYEQVLKAPIVKANSCLDCHATSWNRSLAPFIRSSEVRSSKKITNSRVKNK